MCKGGQEEWPTPQTVASGWTTLDLALLLKRCVTGSRRPNLSESWMSLLKIRDHGPAWGLSKPMDLAHHPAHSDPGGCWWGFLLLRLSLLLPQDGLFSWRPLRLKGLDFKLFFASNELLKIGASVYSHSFGEQLWLGLWPSGFVGYGLNSLVTVPSFRPHPDWTLLREGLDNPKAEPGGQALWKVLNSLLFALPVSPRMLQRWQGSQMTTWLGVVSGHWFPWATSFAIPIWCGAKRLSELQNAGFQGKRELPSFLGAQQGKMCCHRPPYELAYHRPWWWVWPELEPVLP